MTLLDEPTASGRAAASTDAGTATDTTDRTDGETIDLTDEVTRTALASPRPDLAAAPTDRARPGGTQAPGRHPRPVEDALIDPSGRMPLRGMRICRLRLGSVAIVAAVFCTLGLLVVVGTLVALWNVAQALGFVTEIEDVLVTSLGLERFEIDGGGLFTVVSIGAAILAAIGGLLIVLLAAVYNATAALFGGVALETGPLQRRLRVLSLRHRRLVTVRS